MEAVEKVKLERTQFDMLTLLLLPLFLAFGYMLAYAARIWSFWFAVQLFGYYPVTILKHVPIGFSSALHDFPGILCLYVIVFTLAACRGTPAALASAVLLVDWTAVVLADASLEGVPRAELLSYTWGSLVLIIASAIPWFVGRRSGSLLNEPQQRRLHFIAIMLSVIIAPLAFFGFHSSTMLIRLIE